MNIAAKSKTQAALADRKKGRMTGYHLALSLASANRAPDE